MENTIDETIARLKMELIEALNLDIAPEEIDEDAPLFGEGLGLDSIDGLEILVMLEKNYNIKVGEKEVLKEIFVSVRKLAEYVMTNRK